MKRSARACWRLSHNKANDQKYCCNRPQKFLLESAEERMDALEDKRRANEDHKETMTDERTHTRR